MSFGFYPCILCKGAGKVLINVNYCKMKEDRHAICPLCEGKRQLAIKSIYSFFQKERMKPLDEDKPYA